MGILTIHIIATTIISLQKQQRILFYTQKKANRTPIYYLHSKQEKRHQSKAIHPDYKNTTQHNNIDIHRKTKNQSTR